MVGPDNFHMSRMMNRCAHFLIAMIVMFIIVLSFSAGKAWPKREAIVIAQAQPIEL